MFDAIRRWILDRGIYISFTLKTRWTGYRKPMIFKRPVGPEFPYAAQYGDWGPWWSKHIDTRGQWVIGQKDGMGQHKGVDFKVPDLTPVHAIYPGVIVASGWENPAAPKQGFGQRVRQQITTDTGVSMTLVYAHLSQINALAGHQVHIGDSIGFSGHTGHVTGPHLHVELIDAHGQYHPLHFEGDPLRNLLQTRQ